MRASPEKEAEIRAILQRIYERASADPEAAEARDAERWQSWEETVRDQERRVADHEALIEAGWNPEDHPRGKTSPESTPGSFAPAGGGGEVLETATARMGALDGDAKRTELAKHLTEQLPHRTYRGTKEQRTRREAVLALGKRNEDLNARSQEVVGRMRAAVLRGVRPEDDEAKTLMAEVAALDAERIVWIREVQAVLAVAEDRRITDFPARDHYVMGVMTPQTAQSGSIPVTVAPPEVAEAIDSMMRNVASVVDKDVWPHDANGKPQFPEVGLIVEPDAHGMGRSAFVPDMNRIMLRTCNGSLDQLGSFIQQHLGHELGHFIEKNNPTVREDVVKFFDHRTQHDANYYPLLNLYQMDGLDSGLDASEVVKPDHWPNFYWGKRYPPRSEGEARSGGRDQLGATELLSSLIETYMHEPHHLIKEDPESFDFIDGLLKGRRYKPPRARRGA